jgi:hypothetical protein
VYNGFVLKQETIMAAAKLSALVATVEIMRPTWSQIIQNEGSLTPEQMKYTLQRRYLSHKDVVCAQQESTLVKMDRIFTGEWVIDEHFDEKAELELLKEELGPEAFH